MFVVALEIVRSLSTAGITVDALLVDEIFTAYVVFPFLRFVSHAHGFAWDHLEVKRKLQVFLKH